MPLVPAKCTNCGASLTVDSSKEAAVCEFCGTPFIVEKAITNVTIGEGSAVTIESAVINIQGGNQPSADNLLKRGEEFEKQGNYDSALEYYNKVLDIDYANAPAREAITRVNDRMHGIPLTIPVVGGLFSSNSLTLTREGLTLKTKKAVEEYPIESIVGVKRFDARLTITTTGSSKRLSLATGNIHNATLMEQAIHYLKTEE